MNNDTIELVLPVSAKKVVLRNYTTRKDDDVAEVALYAGVAAQQKGTDEQTISFPIANVMASQRSYIPRLIVSIDDDERNISTRLDDLRSEDYAAIEEAVSGIVEQHSPKVAADKQGSKLTTSAK